MEQSDDIQPAIPSTEIAFRYAWMRVLCKMFCTFMYGFLILIPWITEIIVVTQISTEDKIVTVLVCGVIQTIISIIGGLRMGIVACELPSVQKY